MLVFISMGLSGSSKPFPPVAKATRSRIAAHGCCASTGVLHLTEINNQINMENGHGPNKGTVFYHGHLTFIGISNAPPGASAERWLIKKGKCMCTHWQFVSSFHFNGSSSLNKVKGIGSRACNPTCEPSVTFSRHLMALSWAWPFHRAWLLLQHQHHHQQLFSYRA